MKITKEFKIVIAALLGAALVVAVVVSFLAKSVVSDVKKDTDRYSNIQRHIGDTDCPKCNGKMENGFIIDRGRTRNNLTTWVQGTPQADISGVNSEPGSVIVTMRCKACGYLESYAK